MVGPSGLPGSRSLAQPSLPVSSACCRHRPWVEEVAMLMKDLDRLLAQLGPYPEEKDVQKVVPKAEGLEGSRFQEEAAYFLTSSFVPKHLEGLRGDSKNSLCLR